MGYAFGETDTNEKVIGDNTAPGDFAISFLVLSAAVMKADGSPKKSELNQVKKFLSNNYNEQKSKDLLQALKKILTQEFELAPICRQIRTRMSLAQRRVLLNFLYDIAHADGYISDYEHRKVMFIGLQLQIPRADILSLYASYGYQSHYKNYKKRTSINYYQVLEITKSATNEEIRKAYRSMVKKHHPDKVKTMGEVAVKEAEKRIKQINEAYEAIKKERGIK